MKYVVLGAAGQLGRDLCPRLQGEVVPVARDRADLTRPESLTAMLDDLRPDVLINCAAYNFVDRAETEPERAFAVNAWGVRSLAAACAQRDCALVSFSSDYVFGLEEDRHAPYTESDPPGPLGVYGLSKLVGEYCIRSLCPRHYIIRTCGLYGVWGSGGKGGNFVETMLRLAGEGKPLRVVGDQICTPTYTSDVAAATVSLIQTGRFGLYHLTNAGSCSWHDFARAIFDLERAPALLSKISSREYNAPARRPAFSVLGMVALEGVGLAPMRPWRDALAAYLQERRALSPEACPPR